MRQPTSPAAASVYPEMFTARDRDVLRRLAEGATNREIAADLALSEGTVKNYISALLAKASLHDRTQLALLPHATASRRPSGTAESTPTQGTSRAGHRTDALQPDDVARSCAVRSCRNKAQFQFVPGSDTPDLRCLRHALGSSATFFPAGVDASGCVSFQYYSGGPGNYVLKAYQNVKGRQQTLMASTTYAI